MSDSHPPKRVAIAIELHWNLPWHLDCYQGIVDYGQEHGWDCITDPYLSGATGDHDLSIYDGVVGRINASMAERVVSADCPAVTLLYGVDLHSVRSDAQSCARYAAEHLVSCGYRQQVYLADTDSKPTVTQAIFKAYSQAVAGLGCPAPLKVVFDSEHNREDKSIAIRQAITQWILEQDKPIGLYIMDMTTARYLAQICLRLGFRVPEDVGIVVHTADKLTATSITPTLSSIVFDHWEQGYQAAAVLDRLMQGNAVEPRTRYITKPRVISRESTDCFICDDELVSQAMRSRRRVSPTNYRSPAEHSIADLNSYWASPSAKRSRKGV